jgi:predicted DNA-binding transcriptional regulator YafY
MAKVREEGFSKDADKLVRRLSLVALLLSRNGQPASSHEIREKVEGYPLMTDDAFKRRFYEDRAELAALGIDIAAEPDSDGGELYSLPASSYYLPPIELDHDELAALAACLVVLEDRFAYSQPLRLALLSLAQGRPELVSEAATPALAVLPEEDEGEAFAALPKLQAAIADRKAVKFEYYAIGRDQVMERIVDPYGLQLVAGEWYLLGWCHLRQDQRTFRLSRIRSRVTHATRAPHDFTPPADFDIAAYRDRPAWQLGGPRETARIRIDASMAWWVEAHDAHCGVIERLEGGAVVFTTPYANARPLIAWTLGLAEAAEVLAPQALRDEVALHLRRLKALLDSAPPQAAAEGAAAEAGDAARGKAPKRPRRRAAADWHVAVDRFTRLTALTTYLLRSCGADDQATLDVAAICAALDVDRDTLQGDVRLLNLVNFGADGALLYAEFKGRDRLEVSCDLAAPAFTRPARLSPLQADTLLLAVELVGGQLPSASGAALSRAAAKVRAARRDAAPTIGTGDRLPPADGVLDAVNAAIKERRLLAIEYWREGTDRVTERTVEPYLLLRNKGEWYFVCWCRKAQGTRVFRVATTKEARLLAETFEPRPDVELDLYRREGIPTTASYAPRSATVWYSPVVRRWIEERQPVRPLPDGSCLAAQPYVDPSWLTHYLLRFAGQARPLSPALAVDEMRAAVARILEAYEA